jgi:hypothetical protein
MDHPFLAFILVSTEFELKSLMLAKQVLYHLSHTSKLWLVILEIGSQELLALADFKLQSS